jgi:high affinity sulfate transporter 1
VAGITLAMFVLPESMAYASLAGLPGQYGIYCCLAAGVLFALFTNGRQVAVGPTSAISLMVGTAIATLSNGDPGRGIAIAQLTALGVFLICILAYLFKLSSLINFIGPNVLMGFKTGAAFVIAATQLPKLFGVEGGGANFFERIYNLAQHLPETNTVVLLFGLAALLVLLLGNHFLPGRPVSLLVVVGSIVIVSTTTMATKGLHLTGYIPAGLPDFAMPSLRFHDVEGIFGLVFGAFFMAFVETSSVARTFADKHEYPVDVRQELIALGAANLSTAFASGYPVSGGLSQSTVNDKAGAKTPASLIVCSAVLALILLYFTGLFKNLPEVILAVVVLDAITGLMKFKELKRLYQLSKAEFAVAMVAVFGVLTFGILKGVLIAAVLSLVLLIKRVATPNVAVLGYVPGTNRFTDVKRHPDNVEVPNVKVLRIESGIFYFNEQHIDAEVRQALATVPLLKQLVLDMSSVTMVDVSGADMLNKLCRELKQKEVDVKMVEALAVVRDALRKQGLEEIVGHISRMSTIGDTLHV